MRSSTVLILILITFSAIASSGVVVVAPADAPKLGLIISHLGLDENRPKEFNLLVGVPRSIPSNCSIVEIESSVSIKNKHLARYSLSDTQVIRNKYSSRIIASKLDDVSISVGARYNCSGQPSRTIYYDFGSLGKLVTYYQDNGLISEI